MEEGSSSHQSKQPSRGGYFIGRRPYQRGRGIYFIVKHYICNKISHKSNKCLYSSINQGSIHIAQDDTERVK